jgi:HlyD family secretion protein
MSKGNMMKILFTPGKHKIFLPRLLIAILLLAGCAAPSPDLATPAVQPDEPETVINVTGIVVPSQWTSLSFMTGGKVSEILVEEGEVVEAGQPLVRLVGSNPTDPAPSLVSSIKAAELELESAQQALNALDDQAKQARMQAGQTISATVTQLRDLQYQLENLYVPEDQEALDPLTAYLQAREQYENAWTAFEPYRTSDEDNNTRKERLKDLDLARSDYNTAIRRLNLTLSLSSLDSTLEQARQDYASYADGPKDDTLVLAQMRLENARAALQAIQASQVDLSLLAPFAGTVSDINIRNGEVVSAGVPVLLLADLTMLRVETTDLNEIDMARIQVGDPVMLSFDALPLISMPARVLYIPPKAAPGTGVNYRVVIGLEPVPDGLRWGMSAFVDITPQQ